MTSIGYLTYVSDMLAQHGAVVIPGFGGFITQYKPATIDVGRILPPTNYIAFNEQLDIHHNGFAQYLDEETSAHYSPRLFEQFLSELKLQLKQHEVIVVPRVGRLYQDHEGITHFMPDLLNLNNDTFGLPILEVETVDSDAVLELGAQVLSSSDSSSWNTAISSAATVAMLFMFAWILIPTGQLDDRNTAELGMSNIFLDNSAQEATANSDKEESIDEVATQEKPGLKESETIRKVPEKKVSLNQSAIIIVGAYGSVQNATRMVDKLDTKGFESYQDKTGSLNRIGLKVDYNTSEELETILQTIQKDITSRAWILK